MKTDKMITVVRLVIFLIIACVPGIFIVTWINSYLGAPMYSNPAISSSPVVGLANFCMMLPAFGVLVTRVFTKQGFKDALLEFNARGNLKYYAMAVLIPLAYGTIGNLLSNLASGADLGKMLTGEAFWDLFPIALYLPASIIPCIIMFFGEEFGWRGYLIPQLEKLMPTPAAVIVGGVIWGLWHAPITISGHNFGVDYPGFPYVGILLMILDCICMGAFLTLLTRRTKSVWPAVIAHGINNTATTALLIPFISPTYIPTGSTAPDVIATFLIYGIPVAVTGIVSFVLLCLDWKKERKAA